jgi:hypothetical protein
MNYVIKIYGAISYKYILCNSLSYMRKWSIPRSRTNLTWDLKIHGFHLLWRSLINWLKHGLMDLNITHLQLVRLYCDNKVAIHIIQTFNVPTTLQSRNLFRRALGSSQFSYLLWQLIWISSVSTLTWGWVGWGVLRIDIKKDNTPRIKQSRTHPQIYISLAWIATTKI